MTKISNYKFQLRGTLIVWGSTVPISNDLELDAEVVFTDEACVLRNRDKTIIERVRASATGGVLTLLKRGMEQDSEVEDSNLEKEWREGAICYMTILWPQLADTLKYTPFQWGMSGGEFTTTAARDAALGGDWVATEPHTWVYVVATDLHYNYRLWTNQREPQETWTVTPNASGTVTGSVRLSDAAQFTAGTVDESWNPLVPQSDVIQAGIQSWVATYWVDAGWDDAYVVALTPTLTAYTTWQRVWIKVSTANTGACNVNIDSLGSKSIKTKDGNDPQSGAVRVGINEFVYDGTNMVLQSEDFAWEWRKGIVAGASNAEAIAWSDTANYTNSSQLPKYDVITATRQLDWANGAVTYNHSLGRNPKVIQGIGAYATGFSVWMYDWTSGGIGGRLTGTSSGYWTTFFDFQDSAGSQAWTITAVSSTNFTITRAKTSTPWSDTISLAFTVIW